MWVSQIWTAAPLGLADTWRPRHLVWIDPPPHTHTAASRLSRVDTLQIQTPSETSVHYNLCSPFYGQIIFKHFMFIYVLSWQTSCPCAYSSCPSPSRTPGGSDVRWVRFITGEALQVMGIPALVREPVLLTPKRLLRFFLFFFLLHIDFSN